jgi:hypothetical protein
MKTRYNRKNCKTRSRHKNRGGEGKTLKERFVKLTQPLFGKIKQIWKYTPLDNSPNDKPVDNTTSHNNTRNNKQYNKHPTILLGGHTRKHKKNNKY